MFNLSSLPAPAFGPTGETVFTRTYSRPLPNGVPESWAETCARVVTGNLSLVHGPVETWNEAVVEEAQALFRRMFYFEVIPAGRHLWASGVAGRQYLFNCHVSGWGETFADHFEFTFMRLMEGGGVGANYSSTYVQQYGAPKRALRLHVVVDPEHDDADAMSDVVSHEYDASWHGAFRVEDSREGWAEALVDLIGTFFSEADVKHADRVYDVSLVRPKGSKLRTFGGTASGPLPLAEMLHRTVEVLNAAFMRGYVTPLDAMAIDHAVGACVVAGGVRRSARMSIVKWDDRFIFDFINAKAETGDHWTTNISVEVDDAFFNALSDGGHVMHAHAVRVHHAVVKAMLDNGEPGYWNSTLSNVGEVEPVQATNPCGEIALQGWENCNLGHVNMEAFANKSTGELAEAHRLMTRFLMRATFGDVTSAKQAGILARNRRIGVGHFGVQGYLVRRGIRYSHAPDNREFRTTLRTMKAVVRDEARQYAFDLRIPEPVKVTTVAPTGSIAKLPGATEGIHPVYARYFIRRMRFSMLRPEEVAQVEEFRSKGYHVEPCIYAANTMVVSIPTKERLVQIAEELGYPADIVEDAAEVPLEAMLRFQEMYQRDYADNAVSYTINVPEGRYDAVYLADRLSDYLPRLKGTTVMVDGSRPQAPYERVSEERYYAEATALGIETVDDAYDAECASGACPIR